MNPSLYVTLFLATVTLVLNGCGTSKSSEVMAASECVNPRVRMGGYCVEPQRSEGDFALLTMEFGGDTMKVWYHRPTNQLLTLPEAGTMVSFDAAKELCADAQNRYYVEIPSKFRVPNHAEFTNMIKSWPLAKLFPTAVGRYWTSTTKADGSVQLVDFRNGDEGESMRGDQQSQVFCIAQL